MLSEWKDPDDVLNAWVEMTKERRLVPSQVCLGQVLNVLASNGRPTAAQAMLSEWKDMVGANCVMYTTVIKGLARAKDFDRAMEMWEQMRREGVEPNVKAYNTLLDACARAGKIDTHGKEILEEMARKKIPVASVTVSTAVKGYCSKGLLAEAAASLGEAFAEKPPGLAHPERPFSSDASAYNALLDGCVKAGDYARFDETYSAMQAAGVKPSSFTLTALVKRYGNAGMLDAAFACVEEICAKHGAHLRNLHVATCLISASFRNKAPQRAFAFFEENKAPKGDLYPDAVTFATLIHGTKALGPEDALPMAVKLAGEALTRTGPGLPDYAVMELVERLAAGNALSTLGHALVKQIEAGGSPVPRAIASALSRKVAASVGVGQEPWKVAGDRRSSRSSHGTPQQSPHG